MEKIYGEVCDLAIKRNVDEPLDVILTALANKISALMQEARFKENQLSHNREGILYELGNVQIILFEIAQRYGVCYNAFIDAIKIQHMVNVKREKSDE